MISSNRAGARGLLNPYRYFFGNDVFISYARSDGTEYARQLAHALTGEPDRLSVAFDHWQTHPGVTPPQRLLRAARSATALLLVASPASRASKAVDEEVAAFLGKPGPIVLVGFHDVPYAEALWNSRLAGVAPAWEPGGAAALANGEPDEAVLDRIRQALGYWRRNRRIQYSLGVGIGAFALASSAAVAASVWAARELGRAEEAIGNAAEADEKAVTAMRQASAAETRAGVAAGQARDAQGRADAATRVADRQVELARQATQTARAAEQQAATARAAADAASARADRSQARAEATDLAQRAQDILASSPGRAREAAQLALQSIERAPTSWGDLALRHSLLMMPRYQGSVPLRRNELYRMRPQQFSRQVAAGPNGLLARWSHVDDPRQLLFDVELTDTARGRDLGQTMSIPGYIADVQFLPSSPEAVFQVERWAAAGDSQHLVLLEAGGASPVELPPADVTAYAVNPVRREVAVARPEAVEIWTLERAPQRMAVHPVPGVTDLAYEPGGTTLFAREPAAVWSMGSGAPRRIVEGSFPGTAFTATRTHLVVGARSYDLATSVWDHDGLDATRILPAGEDRILLVKGGREAGEVELRDLALSSIDYEVAARQFACPRFREEPVIVTGVTLSPDGRQLALGCASGLVMVIDLQSGTTLEQAPVADLWPAAIWFDRSGTTLGVYGERQRLSSNPVTAEISTWRLVNRCLAPLEDHAPSFEEALAPDGRTIVQWGRDEIRAWDVESGRLRARIPVRQNLIGLGKILALSANGDRVALFGLDGAEVTMWDLTGDRLTPLPGISSTVVGASFGGPSPIFAAITATSDRGRLIAAAPAPDGRWRLILDEPAGVWLMRASPDDIQISPVAVSERGSVAYLAPSPQGEADQPESFREVLVRGEGGVSWSVTAPSAVSALVFTSAEDLVVGTRDGSILVARRDAPLRMIGRHDNTVSLLLTRPGGDELVAADRGNTMRGWNVATPAENVGLRGYMETPLSNYGISNYSEVGLRGLALRDDTLLTLHRDGSFASQLLCWRFPPSSGLRREAVERLGPAAPPGMR